MPSPFATSMQIAYQTPDGLKIELWGLNILAITDSWDAALVRHDFINVDGAIVDNLGFHARQIRFTTYWFGDQATFPREYDSPTYENHFRFMNAATNSTGIISFSHPKYGTIKARIESLSAKHDDTQNYAEVEIGIVEDNIKTSTRVITNQDIEVVSEKLQADALNAEMDKLNADLEELGMSDSLKKFIDVLDKITAQINKASAVARKWMQAADNVVAQCEAFAANIEQAVTMVQTVVNYGPNIASRMVGTYQRVTDRIGALVETTNTLPSAITSAYSNTLNLLIDSVAPGPYQAMFQQQIRVIGAAKLGVIVARAFAADTRNRNAQARAAGFASFDLNGRRIGKPIPIELLTVYEIERSLYNLRALIQDAIDIDRNNDPIKNLAKELLLHVDQLKLKSLDIREVTIPNMPMHIVCMQFGLPYNQAGRIHKINAFPCPNFVQGSVSVYVQP